MKCVSTIPSLGTGKSAIWRLLAERLEVGAAQRPFPHEQFVLHAPLAQPARDTLIGARQGERDPAYVVPGRHVPAQLLESGPCQRSLISSRVGGGPGSGP